MILFLIVWNVAVPFLASFLSAAAALGLVSIPMRRLPPGAHWSLRAREFWPLRTARALTLIWLLSGVVVMFSTARGNEDSPDLTHAFLTICSVIAGCLAGSWLAGLGLKVPPTAKAGGLRSLFTRWLLFPLNPATILLMLLTLHEGLTQTSLITAGFILVLLLLLCMGGSITLLKLLGVLKPAPADIQETARALAAAEGAPLRSVQRMSLGIVNAFAGIWTGDLILTDAAVTVLDPDEIQSVMAHEIGHLKEPARLRWKRLAILPGFMAMGLMPAALVSDRPMAALGLMAAYFLIKRQSGRLHRRLEVQADQAARQAELSDGLYARALEKIYEAGLIPAVLPPPQPYPNLHDRMISAGVMPDFDRPAPPQRFRGILAAMAAAVACFFLWKWLNSLADSLFQYNQ